MHDFMNKTKLPVPREDVSKSNITSLMLFEETFLMSDSIEGGGISVTSVAFFM